MKTEKETEKLLDEIAQKHLHIESLKTRSCDRLDFHNVSVWGVKSALLAAYIAGAEEIDKMWSDSIKRKEKKKKEKKSRV
jgi:hypothetical protein